MEALAEEIRAELVEKVSANGGHLASNLGVVELTMALHRVFDSPHDHIIFDVGHQSYVHKMLTGRLDKMDTLRQAEPSLKVYIHEADAPMLTDADKNAFAFFFRQDRVWNAADVLLKDGDEIKVGDATLTLVHTPGHSPGSSCFLCAEAGVMFTGDTLFADNIGRDDLWGGNFDTLRRSLLSLRSYDGNLTIYPGHGDEEKLSRALDNIMYI